MEKRDEQKCPIGIALKENSWDQKHTDSFKDCQKIQDHPARRALTFNWSANSFRWLSM